MSDFLAKITYHGGVSHSLRSDGRKWLFMRNKAKDCDSKVTALKLKGLPGFSVSVIAGSLDEDAPAAQPARLKLRPKSVAGGTKKKVKKKKK